MSFDTPTHTDNRGQVRCCTSAHTRLIEAKVEFTPHHSHDIVEAERLHPTTHTVYKRQDRLHPTTHTILWKRRDVTPYCLHDIVEAERLHPTTHMRLWK